MSVDDDVDPDRLDLLMPQLVTRRDVASLLTADPSNPYARPNRPRAPGRKAAAREWELWP
ncbi:hypothetical protein ACIQU6_30235 [Streptomyces sp. NPDC090442]|uniref:hypothetical protein n=1 Tax=Streptomyces sp. NPDC090442 TaxID=3365962 RepID=UPI003814DA36